MPPPNVQYGAGVTKEIICPKNMVGRVIGKGGETIKALQKNFGCNIQIDQTIDPMKITVAGQPTPVESAAAAVTEIINGGNPYLGPPGGGGGYGGETSHAMYLRCLYSKQACDSHASSRTLVAASCQLKPVDTHANSPRLHQLVRYDPMPGVRTAFSRRP